METVTKANKKNGEILLGFRKQNKMSQTEIAEIIGRDRRDISKYETGQRAIPQNSIEVLNKKYGLKLKSTGKVIKVRKNSKAVDIENKKAVSKVVAKKIETKVAKEKSFRIKGTSFGKRLVSLRESMGLNQSQFAKKFNFENSRLSRLESEKTTNINIASIKALFKAGVDVKTLLK